jgi:hypothetical protein
MSTSLQRGDIREYINLTEYGGITMKNLKTAFLAIIFGCLSMPVHAGPILFDWAFNIDGGLTFPGDALPASVDATLFDFTTGLGIIDVTLSGAGTHNVTGFFDHEIDESINTFFNENGVTGGAPSAEQSWEIDEPGYIFGNIFDNLLANTLDDFNALSVADFPFGEDVSMAMGFDFSLAASETATVSFNLSETNDAPGFWLQQFDPDSVASVFFWGDITISGGEPPTALSEPSTLSLFAIGLAGIAWVRRRKIA